MTDELIKLTELWYLIIGQGHHKDRDCHWYINTVYSYGNAPKFRVEHYGYIIYEDVAIDCNTYKEAETALKTLLEIQLNKQKEWALEVLKKESDWDSDQINQAKYIISIL